MRYCKLAMPYYGMLGAKREPLQKSFTFQTDPLPSPRLLAEVKSRLIGPAASGALIAPPSRSGGSSRSPGNGDHLSPRQDMVNSLPVGREGNPAILSRK